MPSRHLILCHPFSSCPQSLPASESFPMSRLFAWGGQSIGVSALALVLPMNIQGYYLYVVWSGIARTESWIHLNIVLYNITLYRKILPVQFSHSVVSDPLWPHEQQQARPPCRSPTPGVYSNSCSLSWWYNPAVLSSVFPFSSCLQSFPASGSFQMSQLFASGDQSIGVSASASVIPVNTQGWLSLGVTGFISLLSKGLSRVFSSTTVQKH